MYCCGQPTIDGFERVLEKVCGDKYPKDGPIIWMNMRQEAGRESNRIFDPKWQHHTGEVAYSDTGYSETV